MQNCKRRIFENNKRQNEQRAQRLTIRNHRKLQDEHVNMVRGNREIERKIREEKRFKEARQEEYRKLKQNNDWQQKPCTYFSRSGACRFGQRCRYQHIPNNNRNGNQPPKIQNQRPGKYTHNTKIIR